MKSFFHISKVSLIWAGVFSALLALVILIAAQFHSDVGMLTLNFGHSHTKLGGVFDGDGNAISGVFGGLLAFVALWFVLVVSFIAVVFAIGMTASTLGLVALVLALPLLMMMGALLAAAWLLARVRAHIRAGSDHAQLA